ncbi:tetratricopeptide repeat protein [Hymenobacter yonginensis]|uniref:Tetratricopeptide repeat protein n=1 Tax=Hymenobacter yonginensis TaxID=748197 RepID=A0ABY7PRL9_9BACT|nr:tetratricopeptide repeat protein [Hymenobacter yonginensis]WBO85483.1 tetratricopeptide repeat protein [Hymenobacter yonginensis]
MSNRYTCLLLTLGLSLSMQFASAQTTTSQELVQQGVALHDQGKYDEAVLPYKEALKQDPANITARYELAMTYNTQDRNAEAVALCKEILKQEPKPDASFYSTYGNALDGLKKPKDAAKIYQEGLKRYPNDGPLYFNLGITQAKGLDQPAEAIASMQQSVRCRPEHANSHSALATLTAMQGNRIAALLETLRLLQLEPTGPRAAASLARLDRLVGQGVKQTGDNSISINMSADVLKQVNSKKSQPDNFSQADMLLTMATALDFDEKNKSKAPTERLVEKLSSLCQGLAEGKPEQQEGFVWQYYVPYFVAMEKQGHLPALAYTVQASRAEATPDVKAWLSAHPTQVQALQEWSRTYIWPK